MGDGGWRLSWSEGFGGDVRTVAERIVGIAEVALAKDVVVRPVAAGEPASVVPRPDSGDRTPRVSPPPIVRPRTSKVVVEPPQRVAPAAPPRDKDLVLADIRSHLGEGFRGLQREVPRDVFERLFPGVPYVESGSSEGRDTALVSACVPADGHPAGAHILSLATKTWYGPNTTLPSPNMEMFGPSPNMEHAIVALLDLARRGIPFPRVVVFKPAVFSPVDLVAPRYASAWTAEDAAQTVSAAVAAVAAGGRGALPPGWSSYLGVPELPPASRREHPGRRGWPVKVYVTHPDDHPDGYRKLILTMRGVPVNHTGAAGLAAWLANTGWALSTR